MDPEQKGYMDFAEFSSKIRAGMTISNQKGLNITIPTILPAADQNDLMKT